MNSNSSDIAWPGYVVLGTPTYAAPEYELTNFTVPDAGAWDEGEAISTYEPLAQSVPCVDAPVVACKEKYRSSEELAQACILGVHYANGKTTQATPSNHLHHAAFSHGHGLASQCLAA